MEPRRRLARRLSFANVVACLALFAALGGSAYAGSKIDGNSIAKQSIGGGKLKNETITSKQIKKGSLNSSVIDVSTLTTVPTAQSAVTAQSAGTANTANSATTADSATTAGTATKATSAETAARATEADHANSAETATHATSADTADHATSAGSATSASHADTAGDAVTLDGETAAELTDVCPADTALFGGMCWDDSPRPTAFWIVAAKECGDRGGRLPSVSELVAYILRPGTQVSEQTWSADIADVAGIDEQVVTSDETKREVIGGGSAKHGFRCLFYSSNAG